MKAIAVFLLLLLTPDSFRAQNQGGQQGNQQGNQQQQQGGQQQGGQNQNGQPAQGGAQQKSASISCHNDLLRSHLLRGRFSSEADKMVLCPAIKNNCCTKLDQQRIYHTVNDILPQRVIEYQSKMRMALAKLKQLHEKVVKNQPTFTGKPRRRMFCGTASRKVYNFPFLAFYDKAIEDLESIRPDLDEYYKTYFCNICDADNHTSISIKDRKVTIDAEFCQSFLKDHEELVQMLNIELVEYLESLQHLVDCNHYLRSYNLKFFDTRKQEFAKEIGQCINNLSSKNFLKTCKTTCENIMLSKINVLFEGDYEFLIDAVNLFEKFFEYKESGNFISMKLRLFFKKFVIPRKLNAQKKARFLKELRKREAETAHRKLTQINKKLDKSKQAAITEDGSQNMPTMQNAMPVRNVKRVKGQRRSSGVRERNLIQVVDAEKEVSKLKDDGVDKKAETPSLGKGRVLSSNNQQGNQQGSQQDQGKNNNGSQDGNNNGQGQGSGHGQGHGSHKKIKKAQLIYNKELFNFYSEIKVIIPTEKQYIFKVRPQPFDIDKFTKTFDMANGINPGKFLGSMKFNLPPGVFYKQLFSYRKPDQPDPNLLFFLTDFTPKMLEDLKLDLTEKYKLQPEKKKKKKKRSRILSILTRSEKYLNENYVKQTELKDIDLLKPGN